MKCLTGRDFVFPDYLPRFSRSFDFDILHMLLDIEIDIEGEAVNGTVRYRARARRDGAKVVLDAVEMEVLGASHDYYYSGEVIEISPQWRAGDVAEVAVSYRARPRAGMYFVRRGGLVYVWTQGETEYNRYWVPIPDSPNIKFPWTVAVTVPKPLTAGSNGVLAAVRDLGDRTAFVWEMKHPMSPYLLAIVAGDFEIHRETCGGAALEYYVPRYIAGDWRLSFYNTCEILKFYSEYLGVPYPYERYAQVIVPEFIYGGMENTTITVLSDWTVHDKHAHCPYGDFPCPELEDYTSDPLVAHELSHMWFGDLVTAKDWGHIAINEALATLMEALWLERSKGRDEYIYKMYLNFKSYLDEYSRRYSRPIVINVYKIPDELFDKHSYEKGCVALHTLRGLIGDGAFRTGLKLFLERYKYKAVDMEDLRKAMEEASGRDLEWFWRQFFYSAGHPVLRVSWGYSDGELRLRMEQAQRDDSYPVYTLPLDVKIVYEDGTRELREVVVSEREVALRARCKKPRYVCVDPAFKVMKVLEPQYPLESAVAMLGDDEVYCRLQAVDALRRNGSRRAVEALAAALRDKFWGVAVEAARALGEIGSREAIERLVEAYGGVRHPRVRRAIVEALGSSRRKEAAEFLDRVLHDSSESYYVRAEAARALGRLKWEFAEHSLKRALEYESHLEVIKRGALEGLAELGAEDALRLVLRHTEPDVPTPVRVTAVQSLAKFGPRKEVLEAVRRAMRDGSVRVRLAALAAALELLEPRLLADLQELAERDVEGRVRRMAREVAERIRRAMERGAEYQRLREEVEKLREEYRKLLDRISHMER
jgi:aminopeptidase N